MRTPTSATSSRSWESAEDPEQSLDDNGYDLAGVAQDLEEGSEVQTTRVCRSCNRYFVSAGTELGMHR